MKFVIRALAMLVVFVGLAAASVSSATPAALTNQFSAADPGPLTTFPVPPPCPQCGPPLR